MKTETEIRAKLAELLSIDCTSEGDLHFGGSGLTMEKRIFSKAAGCKALLWALGENDDDRWFIRALPGPPERCAPQGIKQ